MPERTDMLAGAFDVKFDRAGRMTVPARLRPDFGSEVLITSALPTARHLLLFSDHEFQRYIDGMFPEEPLDTDELHIKRALMGSVIPGRLDSAGRLSIPAELRNAVGIADDAKVVGMGSYCEVWAAPEYDLWWRLMQTPEMIARALEARRNLGQTRRSRGEA